MLKLRFALPALAAALFCCHVSLAQAPAGAPAGSTGQCKDGTYSTAASKSGACRGHKGVQAWYTASAAAPAKPAKAATAMTAAPAPAPKPATAMTAAPAPAPKPATAMTAAPAAASAPAPKPARTAPTPITTAAPGGGPGMVWVNSKSKVYHCPTDRYYGKTKAGQYMTEAAAQAAGNKPDAGKKCF